MAVDSCSPDLAGYIQAVSRRESGFRTLRTAISHHAMNVFTSHSQSFAKEVFSLAGGSLWFGIVAIIGFIII